MSEVTGLPETNEATEGGNYMSPGLQRMRIDDIQVWKNKNKQPREDPRGYPGLEITFINEQGQLISDGFYYSTQPLGHPSRTDDNSKCKSEYFLTNLKKALGFGTEAVSMAKLKSVWCWGAVGVDVYVDGAGEPTGKKYSFLVKLFLPDGPKPAVAGDPLLPASNGVPSGKFLKKTISKDSAEATKVPERTAAAAPVKNDDMEVDSNTVDDY